jgi:hypothetical protein
MSAASDMADKAKELAPDVRGAAYDTAESGRESTAGALDRAAEMVKDRAEGSSGMPAAAADRAADGNMRPISQDFREARQEARSLGMAVAEITQELRGLLMKEADLAQAEMADSTAAAKRAGMYGGFAAVVGILVLGFLALTLMFALDLVMPLWLAALITAGVLVVIAGIAALMARRQLNDFAVTPRRTLRSMREDMRWASEQIKQNAK